MPNSINDPSATATPEYHLLKFLTGLVFVAGFFIAVVGLMIVGELKAISTSREVIQADWRTQQEQLNRRMDDLSSKVEMLLLKQAGEKETNP